MKKYIFPIFITALGLFTAYVFYALWHTEVVNPPQLSENTQDQKSVNQSDKTNTPKDTLNVPEPSPADVVAMKEEEKMLEEMAHEVDVPNLTPEQMEAQTQKVYESLTPENHEETMEAAAEAFEKLDAYVEELDAQLAQEEQSRDESLESTEDETIADELPTYDDMTVPANEQEVDMEQEDVNNL